MDSLDENDVVITGVSGVFPKSDNVEEFAEKLFSKENLLSSVPYMPCKLGKINDLSKFDAEFFGFQPHRVNVMDPMARIILEKAYEAIVDSGNNPVTLKGKNCGVYVGIHFLETEILCYEKIQKGASLAISRSFNANRISYWLGVHGPSFTVDSACSSTLLALEMAYKAITSGECESALVGGCHVCLHPALLLHLLKVGALNPNGESRVFDEKAGGFCKAEAIGIFYLQKAKDAKRVYAKVINVRSNHDGSKPLFLSPHGPSQAKLLKMIYEESKIDLDSVSWIEAHATGTLVGDKQEVTAIDSVFKNRKNPLLIGSVKSNMGHAEAAAAVGSISKVLIAMETGFIPPNINISSVRKDIEAFAEERIKVVTDKTSWNGGIVGISGFGMGGANSHAILKSFTKEKVNGGAASDDLPRIVGVSGRTENAVEAFLNYLNKSSIDVELIALLHEIHSYDIPLHPYRAYIAMNKDKSFLKKKTQNLKTLSRPLWFAFSDFENDIKSTYEAFKDLEIFKQALVMCDDILKSLGGPSIFIELEKNSTSCNTKPCNGFYAVIIQIALSTVITELNLSPDNIIGESFGGLVYAYIDGSVSLYEALKIAIYCSSNNEKFSRDELKSFLEQTIQSRSISSRWIVKDKNISLIDHLVNCLFNSDYVEEAIDSIPKNAIVLNFSTNKFSISLKEKLKGESVLIDLLKYDECSLNDLITSLGELYLLGKNPHFQKLYPAVPFPVSRSTKMIAPLIKWKHTVNWPVAFSSFQERMLSGERKVSVSLDDKAYSFISGHEIDSTVLFPGTGYMVLAWETLALIHSKMYTDLSVVFENVRFHKAVVVPRSEPITFSIMVHKGNGNFEILENNQIICTGRMYVPTNARKEMLNVKWNVDSDDEIVMDELDFYRYILIRNYNYKDAFRRIKQINSEGTKASVTWNGNWVTYLDGMMQNLMLTSDIDSLTVPVHIEKLVIDTHRHEEILKSNPSELVAYMDKNMKIVECGGVQVRNCVLRPIPWKINNKIPLNQKNIFSPFTTPQEKKLSTKDAVQLFAQCFMDNVGQQTKNVAIFEVIDEDSNLSYSLVTPFLLNFIKEQLLFNAKLTVLVESNINLTKSGNGGYNIVIGKLPLGEEVNLVICTQALKNTKKLDLVMNSLTDDGFLLTRENSNSTYSIPNHLQECGNIRCNGERFILLRKKIKVNLNSLKVIKISNHSFDWIEELQEAMKIALYDRIILLSEKEPFSGIIGFYNSLRLERGTGNIRCYFLADNEIDSFSIEDEPFKSQLLKDLAINIYQNGTWGCYVKYAIDDLVPEKVQHAFAYRKSNGLKFSIQWYKGNIKGSNESQENLIQVFYASINTADVLLYKNRLATAAIVEDILKRDYALGMEFAGRSQSGKRYMGLRPYGCLSTLIERDHNDLYINEVPKNWSLEDAATVPLAYYTVIYAMILCGKLTHRNTILIHSAGSFIGQAAIHIAIYYNCNIFVTISSIDEKLFIKENFPYIADSKIAFNTDSSFEQMIYNETNGRGVDVILNSLPDDKLLQSVNCLARFGRFVQIKKSDLNSSTSYGSKLLAKNASLYSAILEDILNLPKNQKIELREAVDQHIQNGAVKPLARTTYCYSGIESAFEFASSSRNLGKCVIQIEPEEERFGKTQIKPKKAYPRVICDAEKTYIVCGGLGGMGMEVIQWLIVRGARKIIITSRSGITKGSQSFRIKQWKSLGAHIVISKADISEEDQTLELLDEANSLGDVAGIFNLAGVLRDKMFKNQNAENFQICAKAKFFGTCNLDKFSRLKCPSLEYFVVFSSVAAGHGNLGQTNYAMFNSAVERICENRKVHGLPALAIEWGAVGNVGMFVSFKDGNVDSSYAGNYMQPMRSCLEVLDYSMNQSCPVVTSCVMAEKATL